MTFVANETPSVKLGSAQSEIGSISPHPDGTLLAVCCSGVLHLLECPSLKKVAKSKDASVLARYGNDGVLLVSTGESSVALRDPRKGGLLRTIADFDPSSVYGLALSPNGERLAMGVKFTAFVIDVGSGAQLFELPVFDRTVNRIAWSHDGRYIATRSRKDVGVFDAMTGARIAVLAGLSEKHADICFTPDGALVTPIDDNTLGVWAKDAWAEPAKRIPTERSVHAIAVSSKGVIAINAKLSVQLLGPDLEPLQAVEVSDTIYSIAFSADGVALFVGVGPNLVAWTSAANAKPPKVLPPRVDVKVAGPRKAKSDVDPTKVPWLSKLGASLPAGSEAQPFKNLDEWPGPDSEGVQAFVELLEGLDAELDSAAKLRKIALPEGTYRQVFALAAKKVPYDEEGDGLAPSTVAPYTVATLAKIVERYRILGWELPQAVETLWAWCLDGHWPAGFAKQPEKSPVKLLVL